MPGYWQIAVYGEGSMQKIIAAVTECLILVCAMWITSSLSTFLHEFGHALGYMLVTGDRHWHIRVGWGKRLLETKALTVNLLVFDGFFTPLEMKIDTKSKLIATLAGGPVVSLLLVLGLSVLRSGELSFRSDIFADGVISYFINYAFLCNLFILILSVAPVHYFWGKVRGLESDGLQIMHAIKKNGK